MNRKLKIKIKAGILFLIPLVLQLSVNAQNTAADHKIDFCPDIPYYGINPHVNDLFSVITSSETDIISKKLCSTDDILGCMMAYYHPKSPTRYNQDVLNKLKALQTNAYNNWNANLVLADLSCPYNALPYLLDSTEFTVAERASFRNSMQKNLKEVLESKPLLYGSSAKVGMVWLNGDVRIAMGGYFCALAIKDYAKATKIRNAIKNVMTKTILPDGGTHYVGYQNESPCYHGGSSIRPIIWFYLLLKDQECLDFIKKTVNYIPLVTLPYGLGYHEWSTSPAWKPYYNTTTNKTEALALAYLTGDEFNFELGKLSKPSENRQLALIYRPGMTKRELPNNYMLYDKNTMGPRGRVDTFTVVATSRDVSRKEPELTETNTVSMDGINTFVGAAVLNNVSSWKNPLNAAFQGTACEVKLSPGEEIDWQRGEKWAYLTDSYNDGTIKRNQLSKSKEIYGLTAQYNVSKKRFVASKWSGSQQWVITPSRIFGMVEIKALETNSVYGLAQRIVLCSGRKGQGTTKKWLRMNPKKDTLTMGDLKVKIHAKDFTGLVDTFSYNIWEDPSSIKLSDKQATMIKLHDYYSGTDASHQYAAGTTRYAMIECTYGQKPFASSVVKLQIANPNLVGFQFVDNEGRKYRMVNNTSNAIQKYSSYMIAAPGTQKTRLIKSWDNASYQEIPLTVVNNESRYVIPEIDIPAFGHILLINSNIETDFENTYNNYDDIFTTRTTSFPSKPIILESSIEKINIRKLKWYHAFRTVSYNVYRSGTANGTYTKIASDVVDTTYADTLTLSTQCNSYYYKVSGVNYKGEGEISDKVFQPGLARLYIDTNFKNDSLLLGLGSYNLANEKTGFDKNVSSLKLPYGLQITLYKQENCQSSEETDKKTFTANMQSLKNNILSENWNDLAHSVKIEYTQNVVRSASIEDSPGSKALRIYPNPAKEFITIENAKGASISLFNINGKELETTNCTDDLESISTQSLSNGVYFLRINKDGNTLNRKIMIQK